MRVSGAICSVVAAGALACQQRPAADASPAVASCASFGVGSSDAPWQSVRTSSFTFCVPPHWRRDGLDLWSAGANEIRWSIGEPLLPYVTPVTGASPQQLANAFGTFQASCPGATTFREQIGTHRVDVGKGVCSGLVYTIASWHGASLTFAGKASSLASADTELMVYRTVRLASDR